MIAALTIPGTGWWWVALAAAVVLVPLGWLALAPAGARSRTLAVGLALRTLGIGLLALCLLDPQWTTPRAVRGANLFAVVADNSQGLAVHDPGDNVSRGERMRERLVPDPGSWLDGIAAHFQLRSYLFDRNLQRVRDFTRLDFSGDRSDLGAALQRLRERHAGQPLAGVLLFTDGNATDLGEELPDLGGLPPVYPVVVGEPGVRDVRLETVTVRQTAFDDAPVSLQAEVAGRPAAAVDLEVSVTPVEVDAAIGEAGAPPPSRVRLGAAGEPVATMFTWRPTGSGVQFYRVAVGPTGGHRIEEATALNNHRLVMIDRGRPAYRILYVGGRPGWEFKFLNRALMDDPQLQMVGFLRVARREPKFDFKGRAGETSNPMFRGFEGDPEQAPRYDQPVLVRVNARDENELRSGFPATAEELFAYDAIILDDVESAFFTLEQQSLLRRFASDRGGGLVMLGGADSLEHGGWTDSPLAAALPVYLDRREAVTPRGHLRWSLTREGWVEPWVRVRAGETEEEARLRSLPPLLVTHGLDSVKPGATVLARVEDESGRRFPALVAQSFGAGRVASLLPGDFWRWGLGEEARQADLARFWRQVARWLVTDVPAQVALRVEQAPDATVRLRVTARDRAYRPLDLARARVTIRRLTTGEAPDPGDGDRQPGFTSVTIPAEPVPDAPGQFAAAFSGRDAGAYAASVEVTDEDGAVVGTARTGWTVDPAAEEFRSVEPHRELLAALARKTGGEIVPWRGLSRFVEDLPRRDAPVREAWTYPVWNTAAVFLAVLACFGAEWLWRRWRGLP